MQYIALPRLHPCNIKHREPGPTNSVGPGVEARRPDQREFPGQIATVGNYAMRGNSVKRPSYNLFLVICIRVIIIT